MKNERNLTISWVWGFWRNPSQVHTRRHCQCGGVCERAGDPCDAGAGVSRARHRLAAGVPRYAHRLPQRAVHSVRPYTNDFVSLKLASSISTIFISGFQNRTTVVWGFRLQIELYQFPLISARKLCEISLSPLVNGPRPLCWDLTAVHPGLGA